MDLTETKAPKLIATLASTWALAIIFVGLRVICRKLTHNRIWLDDWLIIASLLWSGAFIFDVICYMVKYGYGKHIWAAPAQAMEVWAKGLFIAEFTFVLSLVFIKSSILAFYWRIFRSDSTIRLPIWILFGMVCVWGIAVILVSIFQCLPVEAFWERFNPLNPIPASDYSCGVDVRLFFLGVAITNTITDGFMIILPLPYIWKMYCLSFAQKVATTGIFIVGIFVTVIAAVRIIFILNLDLKSPDYTWNQIDEMMWTGVEINIGTVCACLPSLKPILNLLLYRAIHPKSKLSGVPGINTIGGSAETAKKRGRVRWLGYSSNNTPSTHMEELSPSMAHAHIQSSQTTP